ncbi:MAG: 23S rRNA (uracil(1939)-C(5))-methyltransferase RlmD [Solobacterium sp.]|nr:23S rRNA (uracil(1939)-C(5))-methyltransferase RlmD [Solobacterium sp.]
MKLKFEKIGINGEGIAKYKNIPVFCDGVLPGEYAEVEMIKDYGRYQMAKRKKVLTQSPYRIPPICPNQERCGACALMHAQESAQEIYKKDLLEEALWKYAHVKNHFIRTLRPSKKTLYYRTACKLPIQMVDGELVSGMYQPGTNHFIPIADCFVHTKELEQFRKAILDVLNAFSIQAYDPKTKSGIRYLVLRRIQNHGQCTLVTGKDSLSKELIQALSKIPFMDALGQSINTKHKNHAIFETKTKLLYGSKTIEVAFNGLKIQLSPESFFQLNVEQAEALYSLAVSKIDPCDTLVEAYCGVGVMSLLAASKVKHVIGIELTPEAIHNAKENAKKNHITNVTFKCGDAAKQYTKLSKTKRIDTLLVDPPRSGLDEAMMEAILQNPPEKIIYVSCNPATLAKNLKALKHIYQVRTVLPFDFFPQTPLVEAIVVLSIHK